VTEFIEQVEYVLRFFVTEMCRQQRVRRMRLACRDKPEL